MKRVVEEQRLGFSPAYDLGLSEDDVRTRWLQRMGLALLGPPSMASAVEATTHDDSPESLKAELERFGVANDAATDERPRRMLNITRDTGGAYRGIGDG
jgi:hypothetical protein